MAQTRSGLAAANIVNVTAGESVPCMFNPYEYTLTKRNQWEKKPTKGKNTPKVRFKQGGSQTLKLKVYFDTMNDGSDVRTHTDKLWVMMMVDESTTHAESDKSSPPEVAFEWGRLYFKAVLTNMTQKFTLFDEFGTPLRCECDLTLEQMIDVDDYQSSSSVAPRAPRSVPPAAQVTSADRMDTIVSQNGGDPNNWKETAAANNVNDPLNLTPGTSMNVSQNPSR